MATQVCPVPQQIRDLVGDTLSLEWLDAFWTTENLMLNGLSPQEAWGLGEEEKVLTFIENTKIQYA